MDKKWWIILLIVLIVFVGIFALDSNVNNAPDPGSDATSNKKPAGCAWEVTSATGEKSYWIVLTSDYIKELEKAGGDYECKNFGSCLHTAGCNELNLADDSWRCVCGPGGVLV